MRTRSRNYSKIGVKGSSYTVNLNVDYPLPTADWNGQTQNVECTYNGSAYNDSYETIEDEINVRIPGERARLLRRLDIANRLIKSDDAVKRSVISDLWLASSQVHKCTHTVQRFIPRDFMVRSGRTYGSTVYTYARNYRGLGGLVRFNSPNPSIDGIKTRWAQTTVGYNASGFYEPDWFALLDKWHESCDSIMPSSTILGESIVENGIFVDAFKLLLNPSRSILVFLDLLKKSLRKKTNLGTLGAVAKTASNLGLGYQFGIAPAIEEIRNVIGAHHKVQSRLAYLRSNVGGYVPVRARMVIPSTVSNSTVNTTKILCDSKETIGCISALAKIRSDIDFIEDWQAYVQYFGLHKFIGLAWELIPFSFVVDWFTNAQEYVNKFTTPKFGSPFYNIRNICHSKKTELRESLWIPPNFYFSEDASYLLGTDPVNVGSCHTTTYTRSPGLPKTSGSIDFTRLGTFQKILGGALLIQKVVR